MLETFHGNNSLSCNEHDNQLTFNNIINKCCVVMKSPVQLSAIRRSKDRQPASLMCNRTARMDARGMMNWRRHIDCVALIVQSRVGVTEGQSRRMTTDADG